MTIAQAIDLPKYPTSDPGNKFKYVNGDLGQVIGDFLPYVYVISGLVLLVILILGGINLMTSGGDPDKTKAGYGKIKGALIGFLIIFISYFVVQLVEVILGVKIL